MFFATIPAILYIDKLGRKPVLALRAIAMGICHITIAIIFAKNENQWPTHKAAGWAAIAMVWLFVAHFVSYLFSPKHVSVLLIRSRDGHGVLGRVMVEYEMNAYANVCQRLDPCRRGLATVRSSVWYRARRILQLDERELPHFF
jgi:hypothetical protein